MKTKHPILYISYFLVGIGVLIVLYSHAFRFIMPSAYVAVGKPLSELEVKVFRLCNIGFIFTVSGLIMKIRFLNMK